MIEKHQLEILLQTCHQIAAHLTLMTKETWAAGFKADLRTGISINASKFPNSLDASSCKSLWVAPIWNKPDRLEIHGCFDNGLHQHKPYNSGKCEIGISATKGPDVIAKDIIRRLLQVYEPLLAETLERKRTDDAAKAKQRESAEEIGVMIGKAIDERSTSREEYRFWMSPDPRSGIRADIKIAYNGEVGIELRCLPLDIAKKVIAVVRGEM